MVSPFNSVADVRKFAADLDSEKCPVAKRQRELREERERKERATRHQRDEQLQSAESWRTWAIGIIDERIHTAMRLGGMICDPIGAVIGKKSAEVRNDLTTEIKDLRRQLTEAISRLQKRAARLPLVKSWGPDIVHYLGDVVTHEGSVYQARKDTGTEPAINHPHWILLAPGGCNGRDGRTPCLCGAFDAREKYQRFDIVEHDGSSFHCPRR